MKGIAIWRHVTRYPQRSRRRKALARARATFACFGHHLPASDFLAYLHILRGSKVIGRTMAQTGPTTAEACEAFRQFGDALRREYPDGPPLIITDS